MPWSAPLDDEPIRLRGGHTLTTLQHVADCVLSLPEKVQHQQRWLINAAETGGGRLMFARIAMMRALNGER
jgi:hypothetical protein